MNTTLVFAFDADQPDTPNSIVVYEMVGMNADVLNIEPSKGTVTIATVSTLYNTSIRLCKHVCTCEN